MVKIFFLLAVFFSLSWGDKVVANVDGELLMKKIKSLINPATFTKDRAYIETIFSPKEDYFRKDGKVDALKVIKVLKENGILNLFFKKPRDIDITFKTQGEPTSFCKDNERLIAKYRLLQIRNKRIDVK